jgi:hypothetical protein
MNYLVNYQHIRSDFFLSGMNYPSQHIPVDYAPLFVPTGAQPVMPTPWFQPLTFFGA